ncbi:MAG TPA: replication-relaxation family protein, partial [Candidatus Limnocylindrales bacterium]|nr:replication-relaxation family protein [Candidatus Limnocylindrales bacterium]
MYTKPTATVTPRIPTLHLPVSLRPRDWAIVALLDEHPMLTTDQIAGILFNKLSTCRERLLLLLRMKFISRWWSDPFQPKPINLECWQPGVLSSRYVARQRRKRQPTENQVHDRNLEIYRNLSKNPIMQTNAFFTQLLTHSRTYAGTQLLRWWSADTVASQYKMISPNGGHGVWRLARRSLPDRLLSTLRPPFQVPPHPKPADRGLRWSPAEWQSSLPAATGLPDCRQRASLPPLSPWWQRARRHDRHGHTCRPPRRGRLETSRSRQAIPHQ